MLAKTKPIESNKHFFIEIKNMAVEPLFKELALRVETQLNTEDYRVVLGSNPTRWKVWNKNISPLHLIFRKRYVVYNVTIMNITPFSVPIWRLAIHFWYNLCLKRHPKILFVGHPKISSLSTTVEQKLTYTGLPYTIEYLRAIDHWIPGYVGNLKSMFIPFKPILKRNGNKVPLRDERGTKYISAGRQRGQGYIPPKKPTTRRFILNYFFPEGIILLNSAWRAYNADKEVLKKSIPTIALSSTDTKAYGFSGCLYTLPAGVNYEDHILYYMFMFYVILLYAKSIFFHKEQRSLRKGFWTPQKRRPNHLIYTKMTYNVKQIFRTFIKRYSAWQKKMNTIQYKLADEDLKVYEKDIISRYSYKLLKRPRGWFEEKPNADEIRKKEKKKLQKKKLTTPYFAYYKQPETHIFDRDEDQIEAEKILQTTEKIALGFRKFTSWFLLQQLYLGAGKIFMNRAPLGLENKINFFLTNPKVHFLQRITQIAHKLDIATQKKTLYGYINEEYRHFNLRTPYSKKKAKVVLPNKKYTKSNLMALYTNNTNFKRTFNENLSYIMQKLYNSKKKAIKEQNRVKLNVADILRMSHDAKKKRKVNNTLSKDDKLKEQKEINFLIKKQAAMTFRNNTLNNYITGYATMFDREINFSKSLHEYNYQIDKNIKTELLLLKLKEKEKKKMNKSICTKTIHPLLAKRQRTGYPERNVSKFSGLIDIHVTPTDEEDDEPIAFVPEFLKAKILRDKELDAQWAAREAEYKLRRKIRQYMYKKYQKQEGKLVKRQPTT